MDTEWVYISLTIVFGFLTMYSFTEVTVALAERKEPKEIRLEIALFVAFYLNTIFFLLLTY